MNTLPHTKVQMNDPLKEEVSSFKFFGSSWMVIKENLLPERSRPMLFVYPHEKNPWAMDMITQFQSELSAWYEEGTMPPFECLPADFERFDLQKMLAEHPLLNGPIENQASHIISIGNWCSQEVVRFR